MSPLQRSKKYLEEQGYLVAIVEKWNPWAKVRQDLFGIFDLLAVKPEDTIAVQVTTLAHMNEREKKMKNSSHLAMMPIIWGKEIHGWRKLKSGWQVKIKEL